MSKITERAEGIVLDRQKKYGSPMVNYRRIAEFWSAYLGRRVSYRDVAMMMSLVKIARDVSGPLQDNPDDIVGYLVGLDTIINPEEYMLDDE